jgi:archaellum component FlaG (FlaF/FlaG flagellin family)
MLKFLSNNRVGALMTILVLAVGSVSIVGSIQFVKGLDDGNINGSIIACVYGACKDNTFNGGTSSSAGGGQPTPTTATLKVIKEVDNSRCPAGSSACPLSPGDFSIQVSGNNPSPSTPFQGSTTGTQVTLGPGQFVVTEVVTHTGYSISFKNDCTQTGGVNSAIGSINAGEAKTCTITNTFNPSP